ncbi:MAG TPA: thioredoxin domain-containing protein [Solirubrobacteraceae bacterium]|nr:thioredoxin domain-containing protein [Solirubrobacteraceae bacterium]
MASRVEQKERVRAERLAAEESAHRADRRRAQLMRLGLIAAVAVIVVIVAIVASGGSSSSSGSGSGGSDTAATTALFKGVPQQGITLGRASAPATLIEFADLQCPFCGEYSNNGLATVVKDYVRTGKLRYQLHIRSFLGPDSVKAAGAAAAATKENRLYQFSDLFYRRQQQENTGYVTPTFLRGVANGAGVDPAKALAGAANPSSQPQVAAAEKLASQLGSNSTPAFYLRLKSGRLVPVEPKALDGASMSAAINTALSGS